MAEQNKRDEKLVRDIVASVYRELGENADPDTVREVVRQTLNEMESNRTTRSAASSVPMTSTRIIITAFGQNRPGMVSAITEVLARNRCNIEDISQKILQDIFALILIVDIADCPISLRDLKDELGNTGNSLGIRVLVQHEDVFNYMHRI